MSVNHAGASLIGYTKKEVSTLSLFVIHQTNALARVGGWNFDIANQKISRTAVTREIHGVAPDYEPDLNCVLNFYKEGESRNKISAAINEGKSYNLQLEIINSQGVALWVRALGNAEFEDGKLKRLYGALQDIDNYKQTEIALKQSIETQDELNKVLIEQLDKVIQQDKTIEKIREFKFLADSIPQIVWTSRPDGNLDYYNQHWFDYTGMTLEQTLGWDWEPILHPDDLENCVKVWTESLTSGKPYQVECRFKRASDGTWVGHCPCGTTPEKL